MAFQSFVIPITTRYYTGSDEQSTLSMAIYSYSLTNCKILRGTSSTTGIFCFAIGY